MNSVLSASEAQEIVSWRRTRLSVFEVGMKSVFGMQRKLACMANHKGRFFTPFNDVTVMKDDPVYKASVSEASGTSRGGTGTTGLGGSPAVCVFLSL